MIILKKVLYNFISIVRKHYTIVILLIIIIIILKRTISQMPIYSY